VVYGGGGTRITLARSSDMHEPQIPILLVYHINVSFSRKHPPYQPAFSHAESTQRTCSPTTSLHISPDPAAQNPRRVFTVFYLRASPLTKDDRLQLVLNPPTNAFRPRRIAPHRMLNSLPTALHVRAGSHNPLFAAVSDLMIRMVFYYRGLVPAFVIIHHVLTIRCSTGNTDCCPVIKI
jgi:hypothetical protein